MRHVLAIFVSLVAARAAAHSGGQPVNAQFTSPLAPTTTPSAGGVMLAPVTIPQADGTFDVTWADGDMDPTGLFTFYYLDHEPTFGVSADDIEQIATPIKEVGKAGLVQIYAGCNCDADAGAGIVCADLGARDCRNSFTWDTSAVPAGTYWVIALNDDPPFKLYNPSGVPVRIAHGGASLPPAVIALRPDGFGSYDKSYRVQWYATGKAPLKIDLSHGTREPGAVLGPTTSIAKNVTAIMNPDGTQSYDWDVSKLTSLKVYFLRVTVTDADGVSAYTDSRYGLSVYHPGQMPDLSVPGGGPADMGESPPPPGCSCNVGHAGLSPLFALLAALGIAVLLFRRRA